MRRLGSIAAKLPLVLIISAAAVSLGVGVGSYTIGSQLVTELTQKDLSVLAHERAKQVGDFIRSIRNDLRTTAASQATVQAARDFGNAWAQLQGDKAATLRGAYRKTTSSSFSNMLDLNYAMTHGRYDSGFRSQLEAHGYADIYLIDPSGNIVYSVNKQPDFARSLTDPAEPLAKTGLATAFNAAMKHSKPGSEPEFADFAFYSPRQNIAAAFVAEPVFSSTGEILGVVAVQFLPDLLDAVVSDRTGFGQSGEALVLGSDHLLRTNSSFGDKGGSLIIALHGTVVDAAISGSPAEGRISGYRGMDMLVAATPIDVAGVNWSVAAVVAENEALAPLAKMRNAMFLVGSTLLSFAAGLGFLFARSVTKPITRLTATMRGLADGNLDVDIGSTQRRDEIGAMARAVEVFRDNAIQLSNMTREERDASEHRRIERSSMMQALRSSFGAVVDAAQQGDFSGRVDVQFPDPELNEIAVSINNLVGTVDRGIGETGRVLAALAQTDLTQRVEGQYHGAFEQLKTDTNAVAEKLGQILRQLKATSRSLKTATSEILSGATDLSERTAKQAGTIQETSAAIEQLAATVLQNAQRAQDASVVAASVTRLAEDGGEVMREATHAMERIAESSNKISSIIGLIDDIAFQTNLLALNASVEAARAGEASQGFAVVAVEVRRLAQAAAQASSDVKALIQQSVSNVRTGGGLVIEVGKKLAAMLDAARSSNELMEAIARESQDQATSIDDVSEAVRQMDVITQRNAALVEETNISIERTEAQAAELDRIVDIFRIDNTVSLHLPVPGDSAHEAESCLLESNTRSAVQGVRFDASAPRPLRAT